MMTTKICSVIICVSMCSAARAGLYEFTLKGQVTFAPFLQDVAVGDPFTIRYVVDSSDRDSDDPIRGQYSASNAFVTLPNRIITAQGFSTYVFVNLDAPNLTQTVRYASFIPNYLFEINFTFPDGTLTSDELPLSLPLSSATEAYWLIYNFGGVVDGDLMMYTSTEVPEPKTGVLLMLVTAAVIPSKAFLLAKDTKISDTTILSQIGR